MLKEIFISIAFAQICAAASWSYGDGATGTGNWGDSYPKCNGNSQSPINIPTTSVEEDEELPIVDRSYFYQPPGSMRVKNNGHTIQVDLTNGYTIDNSKLLPFPAKAAQYHFHWGTASETRYTAGSEHTVDGTRYFGELHVVHYNTKYDNLTAAVPNSDGLAVFGWFISVTYPQTNLDINNLLSLAKLLAEKKDMNDEITDKFSVETLIPPNLNEYYRYQGSLTTPTCDESVVWTVFKNPIEITQAQAYQLAAGFYETTDNTTILNDNFRPVQSLNGRKVTKPRPLVQSSGSTSAPQVITGLITLVVSIVSLQ